MKRKFNTIYVLFCSALCILSHREVSFASLVYETYLESWDGIAPDGWQKSMEELPAGPGGTSSTAYAGVILNIAFANYDMSQKPLVSGTNFSSDITGSINEILAFVHDNGGGKVKMSFGGADPTYDISASVGWPNNIHSLAAGVASIIQNSAYTDGHGHGLDGVDFDIEDQLPTGNEPEQFAQYIIQFLQAVRSALGPDKLISLTIPGQGWNTYWEPLAKGVAAIPSLVNSINFMEYDIWIAPGLTYSAQIVADLQTYTGTTNTSPGPNSSPGWGIPASLIQLGLMPDNDDNSQNLSVAAAKTLSQGANTPGRYTPDQVLFGVMTWDLDRDAEITTTNPVTGVPPYSYSQAIRSGIIETLPPAAIAKNRRNQVPRHGQMDK